MVVGQLSQQVSHAMVSLGSVLATDGLKLGLVIKVRKHTLDSTVARGDLLLSITTVVLESGGPRTLLREEETAGQVNRGSRNFGWRESGCNSIVLDRELANHEREIARAVGETGGNTETTLVLQSRSVTEVPLTKLQQLNFTVRDLRDGERITRRMAELTHGRGVLLLELRSQVQTC